MNRATTAAGLAAISVVIIVAVFLLLACRSNEVGIAGEKKNSGGRQGELALTNQRRRKASLPRQKETRGSSIGVNASNGEVLQPVVARTFAETEFVRIAESLADLPEGTSVYGLYGGLQPPPLLGVMIGDRKVRKMYEYLLALPSDKAAILASSTFDNALRTYVAKWGDPDIGITMLNPNRTYAMSVSLFLVSEFCEAAVLIEKTMAWQAWYREKTEKSGRLIGMNIRPDPLFLVNVLLRAGMRQKNEVVVQTTQRLRLITDDLGMSPFRPLEEYPLSRWDADSEAESGSGESEFAVLARIPLIPDWGPIATTTDNGATPQILIDRLISSAASMR